MIKAVLFDLDNTLIDFMKMKRLSCEAAISAMIDAGLAMEKEKAMKLLFKLYDKHGLEDPRIFQKFLARHQKQVNPKVLASGVVAYRKVRAGFLEPYPHVIRTLMRLKEKGTKLGIVTDAPTMKAWIRLMSMKIGDYFDVVVAYEDTMQLKPHTFPFQEALRRLGWKGNYIAYAHIQSEDELERLKDGDLYVFGTNAFFKDDLPVHAEIRAATHRAKLNYPTTQLTEGFIAGLVLEAALKGAAWPPTPQKVLASMNNLKVDTKGLRGGPIEWTKDNHFRTKQYYRVYRWDPSKNGIVQVKDWTAIEVK